MSECKLCSSYNKATGKCNLGMDCEDDGKNQSLGAALGLGKERFEELRDISASILDDNAQSKGNVRNTTKDKLLKAVAERGDLSILEKVVAGFVLGGYLESKKGMSLDNIIKALFEHGGKAI